MNRFGVEPEPSANSPIERPVASEFPNRVTVELTNQCNLKCAMCPRHLMKNPTGMMSLALYKKIIDEMAEYPGTALVPFFRGESMLHPHFVDMMAYAKRKGIGPIQLATNATKMSGKIARALVDLEIDFISFSIDSINPDTYTGIRKGGDLELVLRNIEYFCDYKKSKAAPGPEIQVSVVRTPETEEDLESFITYWRRKVDRIRIYEEHSEDGNFGSLKNTTADHKIDRQACHKPFTDMVIYWNGKVVLCNHDWNRIDEIGDLNCETISRVWNNKTYEKIRAAHIENHDRLEKLCQKCDHWQADYLPQNQIGELYEYQSDM